MAKIGDVEYRFPEVDEWTNLAYLLPLLTPLSAVEQIVLVPAAFMLCVGSWLWHKRETVVSRRFDEFGMMMVMPTVACVLLARVYVEFGIGIGFAGQSLSLLAIPAWVFYHNRLHETSSFHHTGYWSVPVLILTVYLSGWLAFFPAGLLALGLYGQFGPPWNGNRWEHGPRHGLLWHVPTGLAIASVLYLTA